MLSLSMSVTRSDSDESIDSCSSEEKTKIAENSRSLEALTNFFWRNCDACSRAYHRRFELVGDDDIHHEATLGLLDRYPSLLQNGNLLTIRYK